MSATLANAVAKSKSNALVTMEEILSNEQPPTSISPYLSTLIPELLKVRTCRPISLSLCLLSDSCCDMSHFYMVNQIIRMTKGHSFLPIDRARACKCLLHLIQLPYASLHPYKKQVLKGLLYALDDPKKAVRKLVVKTRNEWSVLAGSSK